LSKKEVKSSSVRLDLRDVLWLLAVKTYGIQWSVNIEWARNSYNEKINGDVINNNIKFDVVNTNITWNVVNANIWWDTKNTNILWNVKNTLISGTAVNDDVAGAVENIAILSKKFA